MRSAIANPKIVDEHGDVVTNTKHGRELKRQGSASRPASVHKVRTASWFRTSVSLRDRILGCSPHAARRKTK